MKHGREMVTAAMLLAGVVGTALAQPKKNFDAELRRVQGEIQRRRYDQVPKLCDNMLKSYTEPHQVKRIRLLKNEALLALQKYSQAIPDLTKLREEQKDDKDLQTQALLMIAQALRGQDKFEEAIAAYRQVPKDYPDYADRAAEALLQVGDILCTNQKKPAEALKVYAEMEQKFAAQPKLAAQAGRKAAEVLETVVKDPLQAAAKYDAVAVKYAQAYDEPTRAGYFTKAVALLTSAGKLAEAVALCDKAEKAVEADNHRVSFALSKADLLMALKKPTDARAECERVICTYPTDQNACQAAQTKVVAAYRAESKFAESLAAAKALYGAAGNEQHIRAAAAVVAAAFRSADGNLGRANEFLNYQRFGPDGPDGKPNTPDDLKANHLAAVKPVADPVRDKRFQAAVAALPKTHEGYRAAGFLYAYWGRGKECAQQFYLAFKSCPEAEVPSAATELVLIGMKSHTCTFADLDRIFEYISYGPKGKDGKQNIQDPFKGL